ncbi:MAG: DUF1269 domain-containing protein [Actinomycetota bacterium]
MADLIPIRYPDINTAAEALMEAERVADDLVIEPDAFAANVRDSDGKLRVTTNHRSVGAGITYGMFWDLLFGMLFFIPFFGTTLGAGLGALIAKVEKTGIDGEFQRRVRELMKPGTSALFMIVERATRDKAVESFFTHGGTCAQSSLSKDAEKELQDVLHGQPGSVGSEFMMRTTHG